MLLSKKNSKEMINSSIEENGNKVLDVDKFKESVSTDIDNTSPEEFANELLNRFIDNIESSIELLSIPNVDSKYLSDKITKDQDNLLEE